jgi:hypothetical protein
MIYPVYCADFQHWLNHAKKMNLLPGAAIAPLDDGRGYDEGSGFRCEAL